MKEFTQEDLENLEKLCRFRFTDEEREKLLSNLKRIIKFMETIDKIDVNAFMGKHNLLECSANTMFEDIEEEHIPKDEFLQNTPAHVGGMVKIPPVIEF